MSELPTGDERWIEWLESVADHEGLVGDERDLFILAFRESFTATNARAGFAIKALLAQLSEPLRHHLETRDRP